MERGGFFVMTISYELLSSLHYYDLTLVEREYHLYSLIDLKTGEWYEKMTIYYIERLLKKWNQNRKQIKI